VLEKSVKRTGEEAYTCRTSEIEADRLRNWIETDQCIKACGLDRKSLGISSDTLLESRFAQQLCSPQCYDSCPNVVDLYFNLAAAEGNLINKDAHHSIITGNGTQVNYRRPLTMIFISLFPQVCSSPDYVRHKREMSEED